MLRGLVQELPDGSVAELLGPARWELAPIMPELAVGRPGRQAMGRRGEADHDLDRLRMYEALLRVAEGIARVGPTMFVLEDLQWVDPASLQLLSFLAHNVRKAQALLVLTVRSGVTDGDRSIRPHLADLSRSDTVERIDLGPLDADGTRLQVAAILGGQRSAPLAERIQRLGDGNPLYTEELLAAARRDGDRGDGVSPKLRELLDARLARLSADALTVLRVGAAAGRSTDEGLLGSASGMEPGRLEAALHAALDEQVLVRTGMGPGAGYRFRHEIMRTVVESMLLPAEAARVHRSYAQALAAGPVERPGPGRGGLSLGRRRRTEPRAQGARGGRPRGRGGLRLRAGTPALRSRPGPLGCGHRRRVGGRTVLASGRPVRSRLGGEVG
jgi:hypothetical protein